MIDIIVFILALVVVCIGLILLIMERKEKGIAPKIPRNQKKVSFSVLIPAREESKVIEGLLQSILNQSIQVDPKDVYIIVERKEDPTCDIAKRYQMNIVLRKDLSLRRKGYAIDDAIQAIKKKKKVYDLYFIFDADNILEKDYFFHMLNSYQEGYDMAVGYRNTKNGNVSVVAASSSLTFTMINTMFNEFKVKRNLNITVSGTGFFIAASKIEELGGYPFHTLTEDYELSVYATLHNWTSTYNEKAIFYDEQPTKYKITTTQRTRWIRGYIDTRKKFRKELKQKRKEKENPNVGSIKVEYTGIKPYLWMIIGIGFYLLANIILLGIRIFSNQPKIGNIFAITGCFFLIYLVLAIITLVMIKREKEYFKLSKTMKIKAILYNPLFLASYIPCAIKALLNPNIDWKKIEHHTTNVK